MKDSSKEEQELKNIVGKNGKISLYYGGYEIIVKNKKAFDYNRVFDFLFKYGFSVYVIKKGNNAQIIAKQVY